MGTVLVDNSKANESISKTGKEADSLSTKIGNGLKTVAGIGAAVGGAVAAGAAALYGMAMKSAETTDRIDKLSNKIGISKTAFQEWDYVLGQNGMDVEKLQVGVKTLTAQMDAVAKGNKNAAENFEKLGLSVTDANGKLKSQEQMTNETIMALANMENGTEKARLATELFGKAGIEMMPMLNNGAEGITELKDRAHELGLVMSDEAVTAGVVLGDTMDDVKKSFGQVVTTIGVQVMPIIQKLLEWVLTNMPQIQSFISKAFGVISQVVGTAVSVIEWLIDAFGKLFDSSEVTSQDLERIWQTVQTMFEIVFNALSELVMAFVEMALEFWNVFGEDIIAYTGALIEFLGAVFKTIFDLIIDLSKVFTALFRGDWEGLWEAIKNLLLNYWENIRGVFQKYVDMLLIQLEGFGKLLSMVWEIIWEGIKKIINNIWTSIVKWFDKAVMEPINTMKNKAISFFNAGQELIQNVWNGMQDIWNNLTSWVEEKTSWLLDKLMFWRDSQKEMNSGSGGVDGSHANGLDYVPFDGYRAILHQGERVLTADENKAYNGQQGKTTINQYFYNVSEKDTAFKTQRATKKALRELALALL